MALCGPGKGAALLICDLLSAICYSVSVTAHSQIHSFLAYRLCVAIRGGLNAGGS